MPEPTPTELLAAMVESASVLAGTPSWRYEAHTMDLLTDDDFGDEIADCVGPREAAHIVACQPANILRIAQAWDEMEAELRRLRQEVERINRRPAR